MGVTAVRQERGASAGSKRAREALSQALQIFERGAYGGRGGNRLEICVNTKPRARRKYAFRAERGPLPAVCTDRAAKPGKTGDGDTKGQTAVLRVMKHDHTPGAGEIYALAERARKLQLLPGVQTGHEPGVGYPA